MAVTCWSNYGRDELPLVRGFGGESAFLNRETEKWSLLLCAARQIAAVIVATIATAIT